MEQKKRKKRVRERGKGLNEKGSEGNDSKRKRERIKN